MEPSSCFALCHQLAGEDRLLLVVQPDAAPDNAADRRFGLSQFHIFVEQDMLGGTAFLCGVFHGNFSQLYVHAENVLDERAHRA